MRKWIALLIICFLTLGIDGFRITGSPGTDGDRTTGAVGTWGGQHGGIGEITGGVSAISIRAGATEYDAEKSSDAATFSVDAPDTIQDGDYIVMIIGMGDSGNVVEPTGFTVGDEHSSASGADTYAAIFYKKVTDAGSEPAGYEITLQPDGWNVAVVCWVGAVDGIDGSTPEDVDFDGGSGAWTKLENDSSPACPAVTTATNGAFAFACWMTNADTAATQPGGDWAAVATNITHTVGTSIPCLNVASQTFPTASTSTGTPEITDIDTGDETVVGMFVFRNG